MEQQQQTEGPRLFKAWRTRDGRSQIEIARVLGVSQAQICYVERGLVDPSMDLADRIEELTGGEVPMASWLPATRRKPEPRRYLKKAPRATKAKASRAA